MLNQELEVSSGTCQQFVEDAVKIATFLDFQMSQDSAATYCRCGGNLCSIGEKKLKIGPHFPKLLSNINDTM